jgi:hypothetical protein
MGRCVLAPDGKIYCVPSQGDLTNNNLMSVLVINPITSDISFITTDLSGNDGNDDELFGGVLAPNGKIYCIPRMCSKILVIDTNNNTTYILTKPTDAGNNQWFFGALGGNGIVYGNSRNATKLLKIDPSGDVVSTFSDTSSLGTNTTAGLVLAPNNKIYSIPFSNNKFYILDVETETIEIKDAPSGSIKWFGGV